MVGPLQSAYKHELGVKHGTASAHIFTQARHVRIGFQVGAARNVATSKAKLLAKDQTRTKGLKRSFCFSERETC